MIIHTIRLREVLFVMLVTLFGVFTVQAQSPTLNTVCRWGEFTHGRLFSWTNWQHVEFTDAALLADIRNLDVSDTSNYRLWGAWGMEHATYRLTVETTTGSHHMDVFLRPGDSVYVYVFAYQSETPFANATHPFGLHGCSRQSPGGSFRIPAATWYNLMMRINNGRS